VVVLLSEEPSRVGAAGEAVKIVQSLTLTHVLIIALLVAIAIPSYIFYRTLNDASMLNKFMSYYEEVITPHMPCTLRIASQRGADPVYSISAGFAFQGSDRWTMGVILNHKPDESELTSYCETLQKIIDHLRRPDRPPPNFPGTEKPMVWPYAPGEQP